MDIVGLVYNSAHEGGNQHAALFHKFLQGFLHPLLYHIQYRRNHHPISAKISVKGNHMNADVFVIEIPVILVELIHIAEAAAGAAGVFQGPVVVPVKDNANLRLIDRARDVCGKAR